MVLPILVSLAAADCPPRAAPTPEWPDRSTEVAVARPAQVAALDAFLFPPGLDREDPDRAGIRTDGVVIVHQGAVVYERYGGGYGPTTPHLAWSVNKSLVNNWIGVAVQEGRLSLEDSICQHLGDLPPAACAVRVKDLLEFSSGFDWRETYEGESPTTSSVLAMLYGEGRGGMTAFVTAHPPRSAPGTTWMYSSGDTQVLAAVARRVLEPAHGEHFPWTALFDRLGVSSATWERDPRGDYIGSSYLYATPRDYARMGLLWLDDGCWAGERVLPEGWMAASTAVNGPIRRASVGRADGDIQGWHYWLNRRIPEVGQASLPWPDAPEGTYAAMGHWKQSITVVPSADLVVVRTGDDRDGTYPHNETLRLALALVERSGLRDPVGPTPFPVTLPGDAERYDNGLFELAAGFAAKEACSCVFVLGRDEEFCATWTRVSPAVARFKVDREVKTVTARALGMAKTVARYTDTRTGCVIVQR